MVRSGVALLVAVRALTLGAAVLLGTLATDVEHAALLALVGCAAATAAVVTSGVLLRRGSDPGVPLLVAAVLGDVLALDVAIALTGGADSPLRLLVCALPIAAAFALPPPGTTAVAAVAAIGMAATAGSMREALAGVAVVFAGLTVADAVARRRDEVFGRVGLLASLRRDALSRPSLEWQRIGVELRAVAVDPVKTVTAGLEDGAPAAPAVDRIAEVARAVRSVVSELHALSARPTNLRAALRELTLRRAPDAEFALEVAEGLPASADDELEHLLLTVARDALAQLVDAQTEQVSITLEAAGQLSVTFDIAVVPPVDPRRADAAVLHERVARAGGLVQERGGGLRISLPAVTAPYGAAGRLPGGGRPDALGLLVRARTAGLAGVLAAGVLAGGTEPGFVVLLLLGLAVAPVHGRILRGGLRPFLLLAAADWALFGGLAALVGDARDDVLPVAIAIPVFYAFVLAPLETFGATFAAGVALELGGVHSAPFAVAFGWAALLALLLSIGLRELRVAIDRLEARHRDLLGRLLDDEDQRRRALAAELHDDALQLLLAGRQELEEADTDPEAYAHARLVLAEAGIALAHAVGETEVDEGAEVVTGGLRAALVGALTTMRGRRTAPDVELSVDDAAEGLHDGLLARLVRELTVNAAKHADASRIDVRVHREHDAVVLEVEDDGQGFDSAAVASAVQRGHVGLAFLGERVRAAGGATDLGRGARGGALVRVSLPAPSAGLSPASAASASSDAAAPA